MSAEVVYSGVGVEAAVQGNLFRGQKFWLAQKVPSRSKYLSLILANGGQVVKDENQATFKIVDHARKEVLPNTYSFTYVEQSIKRGVLENPDDHLAGPPARTIRGVGSTTIRPKGTRTSFTAEDDKILVAWVRKSVRKGAAESGNELYKELELRNSRHTWQSWRDRYQRIAPSLSRNTNTRLSPVSEDAGSPQGSIRLERKFATRSRRREGFSEEETKMLLDAGKDLLRIPPDRLNEIFEKELHQFDPERKHTSSEWRDFWEVTIRPRCSDRPTHSPQKRVLSLRTSSETASKTEILRSDPPESKEAAYSIPEADRPEVRNSGNGNALGAEVGRSDTPESQEAFFSSFEAFEENRNGRKRKGADDLPLRLEEDRPRKRQRQREIPSTPDLSPKRSPSPSPDPQTPLRQLKIRNEKNQNWETETETETSGGEESAQEDSLGREASPVLAEHYRTPRNTQAILEAPTQVVDLGVATPQGGWGSQSTTILSGEPSFEPSQDPTHSQPPESRDHEWKSSQPREQEQVVDPFLTNMTNTQKSPPANLEFPSLFIPEPASSLLPATNPSPQAEINARIDAWIERHVREGRVEAQVIRALESTSLDHHLADDVLEYMDAHGGQIPENKRGVWTARDDADTQSSDAKAVERVFIKHGDLADFRWTYLTELRKV